MSSFFVSLVGFQSVLTSGIIWSDSPNSIKNPAGVFMMATGDGGLVGEVGRGGVVVGGPEVGGPALEVVDGAYL